MTWLLANALPFALKHWRALLLALIVACVLGWWWRHVANDNRMEIAFINAQAELAIERADKARILAQLADADAAAKVAIAAKVEAEKAAEKRLKAREKEWRRIYGAKPENRAWAEAPIPPDILRGLQNAE